MTRLKLFVVALAPIVVVVGIGVNEGPQQDERDNDDVSRHGGERPRSGWRAFTPDWQRPARNKCVQRGRGVSAYDQTRRFYLGESTVPGSVLGKNVLPQGRQKKAMVYRPERIFGTRKLISQTPSAFVRIGPSLSRHSCGARTRTR
jgi:hypothetical protein